MYYEIMMYEWCNNFEWARSNLPVELKNRLFLSPRVRPCRILNPSIAFWSVNVIKLTYFNVSLLAVFVGFEVDVVVVVGGVVVVDCSAITKSFYQQIQQEDSGRIRWYLRFMYRYFFYTILVVQLFFSMLFSEWNCDNFRFRIYL